MAGELGSHAWAGPSFPSVTVRRNHDKAAEGDDSVPGVSCLFTICSGIYDTAALRRRQPIPVNPLTDALVLKFAFPQSDLLPCL